MNRRLMHKVRVGLATGAVIILMFAFQNCAQSMDLSAAGQISHLSSDYKISTAGFRTLVMNDFDRNRTLDVDLDSGVILSSDNNRYCLDDGDKAQLVAILDGAEICEPADRALPPDVVCAMIYQFPYAELRSPAEVYKLGERRDGCDQPVDLCGGRAAQLKSFVQDILPRVDGMVCN